MKNSAVVRPVVLPANLGLSIAAKNLLCLLYLPSSSVRSGDVISNRTMNQIIKPIIGSDVFIVQLLFAGYHANTVDFPLMCTICQDPTHFIVTNYVNRVKTVLQIRRHLQAECVGWIGGLDAAAALSTLITNEFRILPDNGIEDLYTGNLGYLLVSIHHPSRPLMAGGGDPTAAKLIRRSLELFQIVLKFAHENIPFTLENIEVACNSNLLAHRKMYNETKRMLIFILGPSLMNQVVNTKTGLLHNDSKPLLAALDFVSNTEYFFSIDDQDQRILLATFFSSIFCHLILYIYLNIIWRTCFCDQTISRELRLILLQLFLFYYSFPPFYSNRHSLKFPYWNLMLRSMIPVLPRTPAVNDVVLFRILNVLAAFGYNTHNYSGRGKVGVKTVDRSRCRICNDNPTGKH